jgi:prepilin-type N-terminal cleavage/methylation domain-containing protein
MTIRARHHGLTLVEVLLVLALLVVISAVAVPVLEGSFSRAGLQHGGDLLRAAWSRARLAAMESGETCAFRYEHRGSRYQIATLASLGTADSQLPAETENAEYDPSDLARLSRDRLPEGVVFADGNVAASSQVAATLGPAATGGWSMPILFFADGTSSDATVLLANDDQQTLRVTLRGLTGLSSTGEIGTEAAPLQ